MTGPNARVCWSPNATARRDTLSQGDPDWVVGLYIHTTVYVAASCTGEQRDREYMFQGEW